MSPIATASLTFACTFGSALVAMFIRSRLPPAHVSKESQDVVRLGIGLVATMTALLLGLVTAAARSTFDGQDGAVKNAAANILTLDRHLARYGPETGPTRDLIRRGLAFRIDAVWGTGGAGRSGFEASSSPPVEDVENQILRLTPGTDPQRWHKTEALKLSEEVVKARWRALGAGGSSVPLPFLVAVIFWLTVTFASFGLFAPRNATVLSVLAVAAVSVAAAVFLILELDGPYDGLIKVRSDSLRYALSHVGE